MISVFAQTILFLSTYSITCDFCMKFKKFLKREVGGEALDSIVRDPVLCPALWALDLAFDVVDQAFEAGLHAVGMLAWQQLRVSISVETDTASQQLVELLHSVVRVIKLFFAVIILFLQNSFRTRGCIFSHLRPFHDQTVRDLDP
jgi:hypothetical protein